MRKDIAEKWIKALESGEYKQTKNLLRNGDSFCCLGVLCNLHAQAHPDIAKNETSPDYYLGHRTTLPVKVGEWAGMKSENGSLFNPKNNINTCLSEMNDDGKTFKEIAEVIKQNIDDL